MAFLVVVCNFVPNEDKAPFKVGKVGMDISFLPQPSAPTSLCRQQVFEAAEGTFS